MNKPIPNEKKSEESKPMPTPNNSEGKKVAEENTAEIKAKSPELKDPPPRNKGKIFQHPQ